MRRIREGASAASAASVQRTSRAWGECAVYVRGTLRAAGVQGDLRRLDVYATEERGKGPMRFIADFVAYCRAHGLPRETCAARLGDVVMTAVSAGYDEQTSGAA